MCLHFIKSKKSKEIPSNKGLELEYDFKNKESEVVKTLYSKDNLHRLNIYRRPNDVYTYSFETFFFFDEEELGYVDSGEIGYWSPMPASIVSFFGSVEEAMNEIEQDAYFKANFN